MCVCHFPIGILCQVWYLIVSFPDLCTLTYFSDRIPCTFGCWNYLVHFQETLIYHIGRQFSNAKDSIQEAFCYLRPVSLKSSLTVALEEYGCKLYKPDADNVWLTECRWWMFWREKAELRNLPPSRATFLEGVKRAQYQLIILKSAPDINPDKPMPDNYGWRRDCDKYISIMTTLPPASMPLCSW